MVKYDLYFECLNCRSVSHLEADLGPWGAMDPDAPSGRVREDMSPPPELGDSPRIRVFGFRTSWGVLPTAWVSLEHYANGGLALQIWDADGPYTTASSWVPGVPADSVAIKDYSENEGILDELIRLRVISPPNQFNNGLPVCRVNNVFGQKDEVIL